MEANIGREASIYLKYIINHYHCLPDTDLHSYHQRYDTLTALSIAERMNYAFVTLNGQWDYLRDYEWGEAIPRFKHSFPKFWKRFGKLLDTDGTDGTIADSSAQFCVQKHLIQRLPLAAWKLLLDELVKSGLKKRDLGLEGAIHLELVWHLLFGQCQNMSTHVQQCVTSMELAAQLQ